MTDTPRVPSEATTGTPPAPETLAAPAAETGVQTPDVPPRRPEEPAVSPADDSVTTSADVRPDAAPEVGPDSASVAAPEDALIDAPLAAPIDERVNAVDAPVVAAAELPSGAAARAPDATNPPAPARPDLSPAACAALLAEQFPALFGGAVRPLKLRIQADVQARAPGVFTRKALSVFLHRYTTSNAYLNALVKSPQRVDLDGADAGEIADEHRAAAAEELARRRAVHETRRREARAAENAARRGHPPATLPAVEEDAGRAPVAGPEAGTAAPGAAAAHRPPRPPREQHANHRAQGARPQGRAAVGMDGRVEGRSDNRPADGRGRRPGPHGDPPHTGRSRQDTPLNPATVAADAGPSPAPLPAWSDAERERAALLRAYEGSTLTRANFCVLKRIDEATLEAQLVLAKQERASRPAPPARSDVRHDARTDQRGAPPHTRGGREARDGPGAGAGARRGAAGADGPDGARGPRRPRPSGPGR